MSESNNQLLKTTIKEILGLIDREREKEVISRRFGLKGRHETLEAVGEDMHITRERVRQIEKTALDRLRQKLDADKSPSFIQFEKFVIRELVEVGRAATVAALAKNLINQDDKITAAEIHLITVLMSKLTTMTENNAYYQGAIISPTEDYEEKDLRREVDNIVELIRKKREPIRIDEIFDETKNYEHPRNVEAIACLSKGLATLDGKWGLTSWPGVNPRNIRDKIYVILSQRGKPMHYSDIAEGIKNSNFRRNNITKQAVHNELIKDSRFILVGRGIYALAEWGYKKGTIADVITDILTETKEPLPRKEIVKKVLKARQVRESTILLNLQNNPHFKRVGKALYTIEK